MEQFILEFITFLKQFSYAGIVVALTFEFVPAEIVLPLAGYWVSEGDYNLYFTIAAGSVGGTLGPLTLYYLGYFGGRPVVLKYGKYIFIREKQINAADRFFEKRGASVAFFARFIPGIRTVISIPCGMAKMNVWVFAIYTFLATVPMTTLYVYIGYTLGSHWEEAGQIVKEYSLAVLLILVTLMFATNAVKKRITNYKNLGKIVRDDQ